MPSVVSYFYVNGKRVDDNIDRVRANVNVRLAAFTALFLIVKIRTAIEDGRPLSSAQKTASCLVSIDLCRKSVKSAEGDLRLSHYGLKRRTTSEH